MKYTYEVYNSSNRRTDITTNLEEIKDFMVLNEQRVEVFDNSISSKTPIKILKNLEDLDGWREARDRDIWLDKPMRFEVLNDEKLLRNYPNFEELKEDIDHLFKGYTTIKIYKDDKLLKIFPDFKSLKEWIENSNNIIDSDISAWTSFSNSITTEEAIKNAVNPGHYKGYIDDLEWIEAMSKIPTLRETDIFCGALELQVRKYLDRRGGKDHSLQELKKARFYLQCWIDFIETGKIDAKATHRKFE